jgi:hypothetical protein
MFIDTKYGNNVEETDLEYQKKALEYLDPNKKNIKIQSDLNKINNGIKGEQEIIKELKFASIGIILLRDINLKTVNEEEAQIDFIIITPGYAYFVESKYISGNIKVDCQGNFVAEYSNGNKYSMENPLEQIKKHIEVYKKRYLEINKDFLSKTIGFKNIDNWNKPLVVISNKKSILDINEAPEEYKNKVIKVDQLINYIQKDLEKVDKYLLDTEKEMGERAKRLSKVYNIPKNKNYVELYKKKYGLDNNALKDRLLKYRKEKTIKRKLPKEDYIFDDKELEELLRVLPKTKEEFIGMGIFNHYKIQYHSEEIVGIINEMTNNQ